MPRLRRVGRIVRRIHTIEGARHGTDCIPTLPMGRIGRMEVEEERRHTP